MNPDDIKRFMGMSNYNFGMLLKSFRIMPTNFGTQIIAPSLQNGFSKMKTVHEAQQKAHNEIFSKHIAPKLQKSADIMFKNGWWFILSMPTDFYPKLRDLEQDINETNLTQYLVKYYNKDDYAELQDIVNGWELEEFSDNKQIFEDALWAHKKSKFTLTVPTLTIQVEGVIRSYYDHMSESRFAEYKKELKNSYRDALNDENSNFAMMNFVKIQNLEFLDKCMNRFTKSFDPAPPKDYDDIYRNLLFHGQFKNYASIELSTKLFLFLDMLHYILTDLESYKKKFFLKKPD